MLLAHWVEVVVDVPLTFHPLAPQSGRVFPRIHWAFEAHTVIDDVRIQMALPKVGSTGDKT